MVINMNWLCQNSPIYGYFSIIPPATSAYPLPNHDRLCIIYILYIYNTDHVPITIPEEEKKNLLPIAQEFHAKECIYFFLLISNDYHSYNKLKLIQATCRNIDTLNLSKTLDLISKYENLIGENITRSTFSFLISSKLMVAIFRPL